MITMDLKYIKDELEENIFDFDYTFHDIVIGDTRYNKEYIENAFIDYWLYYQIGYATLDEFKWRLKRTWQDKVQILHQQLSVYPQQLNLNEYNIVREYTNANDSKYSDTPNQPMLNVDPEGKYLTDRTYVDMEGSSNVTESKNAIDKYNNIKNKMSNVFYDWLKQFGGLFITDIIIADYVGC